MNKNLLELDENDLLEMQPRDEPIYRNAAASRSSGTIDEDDLLELPELRFDAPKVSETAEHAIQAANNELPAETSTDEIQVEENEIKEVLTGDNESETRIGEPETEEIQPENSDGKDFHPTAAPPSVAETARKSGLAYGAAITLFGSVIFLLALGWLADWFLGTSPWGIVLGIVLGAIIGFYQFFRITSQIFKNGD